MTVWSPNRFTRVACLGKIAPMVTPDSPQDFLLAITSWATIVERIEALLDYEHPMEPVW